MLNLLRNILQAVNAKDNIDDILQLIVQRVREALNADLCSIYLANKHRTTLSLRAVDGLKKPLVDSFSLPIDAGLVGMVAKQFELIKVDDAPSHSEYTVLPNLDDRDYQSFLGIPIQCQRRLLGVLVVQNRTVRHYGEEEEAFLITLTVQLASLIARFELQGALNAEEKQAGNATLTLKGRGGSPGVGIGHVKVVYLPADLNTVPDRKIEDIEAEIARFQKALSAARDETKQLEQRLATNLPKSERDLFDAYLKILDSKDFHVAVESRIRDGSWAPGALAQVVKNYVRQFDEMGNEYFKERAADLRDLGRRILVHLESSEAILEKYPKDTILVGEEIAVSHLGHVPRNHLKGIVSAAGSANSHIAILARALGIPTVMGVRDLPATQLQNKQIIVDGYLGRVHISPKKKLLSVFKRLEKEEVELDAGLQSLKFLPAQTQDGHRVPLYTNTGLMAGIERSLSINSDGIGLYRTEVPFMMRERFPTLQEQQNEYRHLLQSFAPKLVTMRLLDIGGDKALSYFPIVEKNPFLGWRGIRVLLDHPDIFSTQVRAMLRANEGLGNLGIMLPMVTDVLEVDDALALIDRVYQDVLRENPQIQKPKIGVMVEVPSAVYQARELAKRVDFLSVGSNDLTQYLLAVDRNNAQVANLYNSLHPVVLRALMQVVEAAHDEKCHVGICGELAGNPAAVMLLVVMGFDSLSMSAGNLLRAKWVIRTMTLYKSKRLLKAVLKMDNPRRIQRYLERALFVAGLGGLVRPGRN